MPDTVIKIVLNQFRRFHVGSAVAFEDEMVAHSRMFSPRLSAVLGEAQLRSFIRFAIRRAEGHGFTLKGTVRLFIELAFLFGSSFDIDVQYPWIRMCLGEPDPGTQMQRAGALHAATVTALEEIHGPRNVYTYDSLRRLQSLAKALPRLNANGFSDAVLAEVARVHPQKCAHVGEPSLRELIAFAGAEAKRHELFEMHEVLLLFVLMFSFGQGCTADPLYPWIGHTLANDRVSSASVRASQLQRKALTWLRHVLGSNQQSP